MILLILFDFSRKSGLKFGVWMWGTPKGKGVWGWGDGGGGCRENLSEISTGMGRVPRYKKYIVTRQLKILWTRPSRDEFYDHAGFTC